MKIRTCQEVREDIEFDVDIDVNDVLIEFSRRLEEAEMQDEAAIRSCCLPLVDFATRLLARITGKSISAATLAQRETVRNRLIEQAERWMK